LSAAELLITVVGILLVLFGARDIFETLFHPEGRSTLGRLTVRAIWRLSRHTLGRHRDWFTLTGPLGLVAVIGAWAIMLVIGWALIYLPHLPEAFHFGGRVEGGRLVDALNLSLVTLTTLGFGDVTPADAWLRLVTPIEALLGFGLLTASISWLLLIYPALSRRRSLAYEVALLRQAAEKGVGLDQLEPVGAESVLAELTSRLVTVERDFVSLPVSYYFPESDERFALAAEAPYLLDLARHFSDHDDNGLRLRATLLGEAIDDFAATVGKLFQESAREDTNSRLDAFARDHLQKG